MESTTETTSEAMSRVLLPLADCFTPDVARSVIDLPGDPTLQARLDELAEKSTEGALSREEAAEYDGYIQAMQLLAVVQFQARSKLSSP